jgi:hypothetical protein
MAGRASSRAAFTASAETLVMMFFRDRQQAQANDRRASWQCQLAALVQQGPLPLMPVAASRRPSGAPDMDLQPLLPQSNSCLPEP